MEYLITWDPATSAAFRHTSQYWLWFYSAFMIHFHSSPSSWQWKYFPSIKKMNKCRFCFHLQIAKVGADFPFASSKAWSSLFSKKSLFWIYKQVRELHQHFHHRHCLHNQPTNINKFDEGLPSYFSLTVLRAFLQFCYDRRHKASLSHDQSPWHLAMMIWWS